MKGKTHHGNAPFSIRMPAELRTHVKEMADARMVSEAAYICTLIEADMGKRPRRPSRQHVMWRQEFTKIHAAIIYCGKQASSGQVDYRRKPNVVTDGLIDVVAALLRLEDQVRGK
jgi:hypothetical protein